MDGENEIPEWNKESASLLLNRLFLTKQQQTKLSSFSISRSVPQYTHRLSLSLFLYIRIVAERLRRRPDAFRQIYTHSIHFYWILRQPQRKERKVATNCLCQRRPKKKELLSLTQLCENGGGFLLLSASSVRNVLLNQLLTQRDQSQPPFQSDGKYYFNKFRISSLPIGINSTRPTTSQPDLGKKKTCQRKLTFLSLFIE